MGSDFLNSELSFEVFIGPQYRLTVSVFLVAAKNNFLGKW